ncbi:MAG: hypothetical protein KDB53_14835, partial [Planctomycetes bacterium]|nr:hypothetical protein [Planctomycetota bacterium]
TEIYLCMDYLSLGYGESDWDNLVLETLDGDSYTFEYNLQVPVPGLSFEPYSGAIFFEGPYVYESLFVDFNTNTMTGSPMHHPNPQGGNPSGWTYFHDPMVIRLFRADGQAFRIASIDYRDCSADFRVGTGSTPSNWNRFPVTLYDPTWRTLTLPLLNDFAAGTQGSSAGGPFDLLLIDGSAGGADRRVDVALNTPFSFGVAQPSTSAAPADFLVFGYTEVPSPAKTTLLPFGLGAMVFAPGWINAPGPVQKPFLFITSVNPPPFGMAAMGAFPTPWQQVLPGWPVSVQVTMQALIFEQPFAVSISNAVVLRIR